MALLLHITFAGPTRVRWGTYLSAILEIGLIQTTMYIHILHGRHKIWQHWKPYEVREHEHGNRVGSLRGRLIRGRLISLGQFPQSQKHSKSTDRRPEFAPTQGQRSILSRSLFSNTGGYRWFINVTTTGDDGASGERKVLLWNLPLWRTRNGGRF